MGFTNLQTQIMGIYKPQKFQWDAINTKIYKKYNDILQAEAEKLSGVTPSIIQPEAVGRGLYARCKTR